MSGTHDTRHRPVPGGPHVVAIGGGHGLAMVLKGVRRYAGKVTAVVSTGDDGGSSGRLRQLLGVPAPGDLRRCLTAVSPDHDVASAFEHRFRHGDLAGHAVGNLLLAGLMESGLDLAKAADLVATWLGIDLDTMRVLPATARPVDLVAETAAGVVRGQVDIERSAEVKRIAVDPPDPPVPYAAADAIEHGADQIVLGPGSLYASVLAPVVVPGIQHALGHRRGRLVFVCNLRAVEGSVQGYDVARHVAVLRDHGIRPDVVVAQGGALAIGDLDGVELVEADVDRPHGLAHDPDRLGDVLARLT